MSTDISTILQGLGLRSTQPRKTVFALLKNTDHPLSIAQIISELPAIDRVSVYRTIDTFIKQGIVTSVPHGWKQRYELAAPLKPHHHHMYCETCGLLIDIDSPDLEQVIAMIAKTHDFHIKTHTFEISGLCSNCRATRPAS